MRPKISRQRKWQIRREQKGLCTQCSRIVFRADRCRACYIKKSLRGIGIDVDERGVEMVLVRWGQLDRGVPRGSLFSIVSTKPQMIRWLRRWDKKIGGPRYA